MAKNKILLPVFLAIAVLFGLLIGMFFSYPTQVFAVKNIDEQRREKLRQIINYIDFEYVEEVDTDSLLDLTIVDLLRRLDPHSTYIPKDEVAMNEESMRGSFEGIGIEFKIFRDTLTVVNVLDDGPSSRSGIKAGDRILYADKIPLFGEQVNNELVAATLKGKSGTNVNLRVYRRTADDTLTTVVRRGTVPLKSVSAAFMADDSIGYLRLERFAETTADEVHDAMLSLKKEGSQKLILDLRDNPGGLLSAAKALADQFLQDGKMIVFTKDRQEKKNEIFASHRGVFENGEIVVLINEGSASASEIVAGAVQDNDRGLIIGRKSFGKGLVQEEILLDDGSKVRLTTQHYYTPTGRSIQKPYGDYQEGFLRSRGYDHNFPEQDSQYISHDEFITPGGKKVYGGGGIMPDIEVPVDTSRPARVLYHLSMLVNLDDESFKYVDRHRKELYNLGRRQFVKEFRVSNDILKEIFPQSWGTIKDLEEEVLDLLRRRVKSFIAYNLFGNETFLQVYYENDPIVQEALKQLKT